MEFGLLAAASTSIDVGQVKELIDLCKECMSLFSVFPLNILLISGLVGVGFSIFSKAQKATGSVKG